MRAFPATPLKRSQSILGLFFASLMFSSLVWASEGEPYLESVDGRDFVRLERGGEPIELYPGDLIEAGDLIHSGEGGCRIILPGVAEISVSQNTKLQWLGNVSGSPQFNVTEGMIWARVTKTEPEPTATPVPPPDTEVIEKYKFTLRTRAAILGVRGTEFTVEYQNGSSWFSTFEGEVTLAKDEATLKSGKKVERLLPEERISWGVDREPMRDRFNPNDFRVKLQKAHPAAYRLRHQVRQSMDELKRFQKSLKRMGVGQINRHRVRSVLNPDPSPIAAPVEAKTPAAPNPVPNDVPRRLKKIDLNKGPGTIERVKRRHFNDRKRISRPGEVTRPGENELELPELPPEPTDLNRR